MSIDIDKEFAEFERGGSPRGYRRNNVQSYGVYLDSITQAQWEGWLAAKRHAAEVAEPVEIAQRSDCRMTGGICSCRSGGSYGGCRKERDACCSTFAPAAPSGASVEGELLPCPFCGGDAQTDFIEGESYLIECYVCNANAGAQDGEDEAIAAWNRRASVEGDGPNSMCERKTDHIMQRDGYGKTGYVLMHQDPARLICVSDGGAVSWFSRHQWSWLMHNRDHVEFTWPKPIAAMSPNKEG